MGGASASGNIVVPLANGNVMKIPLSSVNITEEVNKTGKKNLVCFVSQLFYLVLLCKQIYKY